MDNPYIRKLEKLEDASGGDWYDLLSHLKAPDPIFPDDDQIQLRKTMRTMQNLAMLATAFERGRMVGKPIGD